MIGRHIGQSNFLPEAVLETWNHSMVRRNTFFNILHKCLREKFGITVVTQNCNIRFAE